MKSQRDPVSEPRAELPASLARARELVSPALQAALGRLEPGIREVVDYHFGFTDGQVDGKAVRPALALLSAEAAGAPAEAGRDGAVAVELVHNFSLLHDDIMDRDRERHHRATAWTVFGESRAMLAGDALATLSLEVLLDAPTPERMRAGALVAAATQRMIAGQSRDLALEGRADVTLDECVAMLSAKTAALLACASSVGAVLAGAEDDLVARLSAFGEDVGIAFQAVDDQLGIWGQPERTGKSAWSDLRQRKSSLPVSAALQQDGAGRLRGLLAKEELSEEELAELAELVERAGGRAWAAEEAERRLAAALAELEAADMPAETRGELATLARFIVSRDF
jgi:geranylgeranyl diphosphate synthase type I